MLATSSTSCLNPSELLGLLAADAPGFAVRDFCLPSDDALRAASLARLIANSELAGKESRGAGMSRGEGLWVDPTVPGPRRSFRDRSHLAENDKRVPESPEDEPDSTLTVPEEALAGAAKNKNGGRGGDAHGA